MMMTLLDEYLKERSLCVALQTLKRMRKELSALLKYLKRKGIERPEGITKEVLWECRKLLLYNRKEYTVYMMMMGYVRFVNWLYREGYLLVLPIQKEDLGAKPPVGKRSCPDEKEVLELLEQSPAVMYPQRNKLLIELFYGSGFRLGELLSLNVADVLGGSVQVCGKGRERMVPLGERLRQAIRAYIAGERAQTLVQSGQECDALLLSHYGQRISRETVSDILRRQCQSKITPHQLRHACATHMLHRGCDVRIVQRLLGHSKLTTTAIYTHVEMEDVKRMLKQKHPRG